MRRGQRKKCYLTEDQKKELVRRVEAGELTQTEAAKKANVHITTFWAWRKRMGRPLDLRELRKSSNNNEEK